MTHLFPLMCNLASLIITKTRMDNSSRNQVIVTFKDRVLVKIKIEYWIELRAITNCVSEEADPWVVWHVRDMVPQGFSPVILQTKDTNVLVSQISFASNIRNDSNSTICAEMYSTDNEDTYCDVCKIAAKLVDRPCRALPIFCALTGCDKTSSIFGENKCKCWNLWKSDDWEPEITSVFTEFTIKREYMSEAVFGGCLPMIFDCRSGFTFWVWCQ